MKVADKVDYARALPLLTKAANAQGPLGDYAGYYAALAQLRLGRFTEARALLQQLLARRPVGYIAEAATLASAETAEALHDYDEALEIYERLAATKTTAPEDLLCASGPPPDRRATIARRPRPSGTCCTIFRCLALPLRLRACMPPCRTFSR